MLTDPASLSMAPLPARVDACELCSTSPETLRTSVVVRHARGGVVQLAACDRCAAAARRLIALAGAAGGSGPAQVIGEPEIDTFRATVEARRTRSARSAVGDPGTADLVGSPVLVREFAERIRDRSGKPYVVRAYGQERSDGTWIGWLNFATLDNRVTRSTGRETTQSNFQQLEYWTTGIEGSYFEGAFRRAS
jgi:hypothetical protein